MPFMRVTYVNSDLNCNQTKLVGDLSGSFVGQTLYKKKERHQFGSPLLSLARA
jgi:hypothetical protein